MGKQSTSEAQNNLLLNFPMPCCLGLIDSLEYKNSLLYVAFQANSSDEKLTIGQNI